MAPFIFVCVIIAAIAGVDLQSHNSQLTKKNTRLKKEITYLKKHRVKPAKHKIAIKGLNNVKIRNLESKDGR